MDMISSLFFVALIVSSVIGGTPQGRGALLVSKCTTGDEANAPTPVNTIVPRCDKPPCILEKGETYKVEIDFDVPRNTKGLDVEVTGIIGGLELPWNGVGAIGCNDMIVGSCPLNENEYWTYGVNITVQEIYPSVELIIKWQMRDDSGEAIWCFHLPAQIV